jgi:hypothetical protein
VLDFIAAGFCVLAGLGMMLGGGFMATMLNQQQSAGAGVLAAIGAAAGVFLRKSNAIFLRVYRQEVRRGLLFVIGRIVTLVHGDQTTVFYLR